MRTRWSVGFFVVVFAAISLAAQREDKGSSGEQFLGVWSGTWEGAGGSGGFEVTLEKAKDGIIVGKVSVTGEPTYKATFRTLSFDGPKMTASYDFPPEPAAEVVLGATFETSGAKGTWSLREKGSSADVASGSWSVAKQ